MSNFEFSLILYLFNCTLLLALIFRSIKKKSPRVFLKFFFLPILLCIPLSLVLQNVLDISDISDRQLIANVIVSLWCFKSFTSYKSLKVTLLEEFLDQVRKSISNKEYFRIVYSVTKLSFFQFLCFSSITCLNYLSGYSALSGLDIFGIAICSLGIAIELWCKKELKLYSNDQLSLIRTGPWSITRHPNLLGIVLFFIGIEILALGAVGSQWSLFGLFLLSYIVVKVLIPSTEKKLTLKYSDYGNYMKTVPKLFPLKLK